MNAERLQDSELMEPAADTRELAPPLPATALVPVPESARQLLLRMFADPYVLGECERAELVAQLRESVSTHPEVSELRVLLGMALCVNLEVQEALEELREGLRLAPDSFIAHLKMGELWMRLRVCKKAEQHTRQAALLARNLAQTELARRQAAAIRAMLREGIERGGYQSPFALLGRLRRLWRRQREEDLALANG
jgi:cytochrome c-type biogenesis protein CcmH/NrfG